MSVQMQIDRISANISQTYSVLSDAGADIPETANSDNLPDTARSIKAVLYDRTQNLTDEQKVQARENIGAQPVGNYALKTEIPSVPVQSVNGKAGAVNLTASDVKARPDSWMPTAQDVGALPSTYTPPNQTAQQVGALAVSGGDMTGAINMNGQPISGLNEPTEDTQAARKRYVDASVRKAAPRNILDNSDFTNLVAQAGISGKHGSVVYAADRWKLTSGTVTYTAGTGLKLNGTITQVLEKAPTGGSWFVGMASGTATIALNENIITITSNGGVIKWAALYEGAYTAANRPEYQPKGYAAELAECRRYYLNGVFAVTIGAQYGDSRSIFSICIDEMRVIPSATITDVIAQGWGDVTKSDYIQDWAGKNGSKVYYNFMNNNNAKDAGKTVVVSATFAADL